MVISISSNAWRICYRRHIDWIHTTHLLHMMSGDFVRFAVFFSTYYTYIQCRRCALMRFHHTNESGKCINNEKYPVCCVRFLHFFFLGCSKLNKTAATTTSTQADAYDTENLIHLHRTAHIILPQKMLFYILCKFFPFFFHISFTCNMEIWSIFEYVRCKTWNGDWRTGKIRIYDERTLRIERYAIFHFNASL